MEDWWNGSDREKRNTWRKTCPIVTVPTRNRALKCRLFYVLLTIHPGMILVNNKLDAQFFMYIYFYSVHVSGSHVPIIRRIILSMRHLVYVTLCSWLSGIQVGLTCIPGGYLHSDIYQVSHWYNNSSDDGHKAARNMYRIEINIHEKLCVKLIIYKEKRPVIIR